MKNNKNITNFVCTITEEQQKKLENLFIERGWDVNYEQPYAFWLAKKGKLSIILYKKNRKLMVQGKDTEEFVTFTLEPEILQTFSFGYEDIDWETGKEKVYHPHAGIDESGKGDFFGPLVIASVFIDNETYKTLKDIGIKDSKNIKSEKTIRELGDKIRKIVAGRFSIVTIGPEAYNRLYKQIGNLNRLLAWGHSRSLENLLEKAPDCTDVLIDKFGNENLITNALMKKGKKINVIQKTKAESDIAVGAASILARDAFLYGMKKISNEIGFIVPRGAGPQVRQAIGEIIKKHGKDIFPKIAKMHFKTAELIN